MKLLDTNVFVYAHGRPHPYRQPCRALIAELETEPVDYNVDTELLQEILHLYSLQGDRAFGLNVFDVILTIFPYPFAVGRSEAVAARRLVEAYPGLSPRDAIHAAVVLTQDLDALVTTDKAFTDVAGLSVLDPANGMD